MIGRVPGRLGAPGLVLGLSAVVAAWRVQASSMGDQGMFVSIAAAVARGQPLYAEVFDNKDPLFFFSQAASFGVLGPSGIFILDFVLLVAAGLITFEIADTLGVPTAWSIAIGVATVGLLSQQPLYASGLSHLQGLVLFLAALLLGLRRRWVLSGMAAGLMIGSRVSLVVVLVPLLLVVVSGAGAARVVARWVVAALGVLAAMTGALAARGELAGYLEALGTNVGYTGKALELLGERPAPIGTLQRADAVLSSSGRAWAFSALLCVGLLVVLLRQVRPNLVTTDSPWPVVLLEPLFVVTLGVSVLLLAATAVWPNHLQVLVVSAALAMMVVARALPDIPRINQAVAATIMVVILVGGVVGSAGIDASSSRLTGRFSPERGPLPEAVQRAVDTVDPSRTQPVHVAFVGENTEQGSLGFISGNARLSCRLLAQWPWYGEARLGRMASCLREDPSVIAFQRDMMETPWLADRPYYEFRSAVAGWLPTAFSPLGRVESTPWEIWIRR